ncbi:hypothetical protein VFPPC_15724 [Pochonia chlamydosporia 170]|uniref:Uncharacterized protein n=1 Tax=Pochonia chlamydosporia 170 TaxID=1380566 RepID=A0A179FQ26_METCM|nr:hypothetical protein VFPPC_15724 [Pochonia chlamydosporia 170]OAQ67726.1 hypothetical protein VFPPC_15724 [Pochonia chlamydosporia 170]
MVFDNDDRESGIEVRSTVSSIGRHDPKCIATSFYLCIMHGKSVESEVVITSDGSQQVQRMGPIQDANDRYNSTRRSALKNINPESRPVGVSKTDAGYIVNEVWTPGSNIEANHTVKLQINYSTLRAVRTIAGDAFLTIGKCRRQARNTSVSQSLWFR